MTRPTVPQLLFAATAVAAVLAMPADALTASSSPSTASPSTPTPSTATPSKLAPTTGTGTAVQPSVATPVGRPSPSTDEQVAQAVRTSPLLGEVPPERIRVVDVHVSTIDPTVAVAHVVPAGGETDPATALLTHPNDRWRLVELGTAGVGCDQLSVAVQHELGLICELS
ncbi:MULTISPECIES: hypothetical protein [unclassified Frankia]|uniref:hypothetical protein n=1 Tax=unclassified Frankia TaxID=2632575 RepID=UPI002AD3C858|nr:MULTISPECIES: hypothetical protein [unclassified Frankia]